MNQLFGRIPDEPVNIGYTWTGRMLDCLKNKPLNDGPDIEIAEAFFFGFTDWYIYARKMLAEVTERGQVVY